jgi:hypothetical protein
MGGVKPLLPLYAFHASTGKTMENFLQSSRLHRASIVSKTIFIVPTDAHCYKNHRMLK